MPVNDESTISDEQLLDIARRFTQASRDIGGFHYPPRLVIRDFRKSDNQEIWSGPDSDEAPFFRQLDIEKMRYAMEALQ